MTLDNEAWAASSTRDGLFSAFGTAFKKRSQGTLYILDQTGGKVYSDPVGAPVWGLDFAPDGKFLAAATWAGEVKIYALRQGKWTLVSTTLVADAGAYGVRWVSSDELAAVCYGSGVAILGADGSIRTRVPSADVGYNLATTDDGSLFIGARNGHYIKVSKGTPELHKIPGASRAVSAISVAGNGQIVYCGGFDGHVRAVTSEGDLLWERDLIGEVWTIWSSRNGEHIVAGVGDGSIVAIRSAITTDAYDELVQHISRVEDTDLAGQRMPYINDFVGRLASLHLYGFCLRYLAKFLDLGTISHQLYEEAVADLLRLCPEDSDEIGSIYFARAEIERGHAKNWEAGLYYLRATSDPRLRLRSYTEAANAFRLEGHPAAALACFRRARSASLAEDDLKLIYTLARSLEDVGESKAARDHLDTIMVEDQDYRDVANRLKIYRRDIKKKSDSEVDYTGITVNLLGPDGPTNDVDPKLRKVVEARASELSLDNNEQIIFRSLIEDLYAKGIMSAAGDVDAVGYDRNSYIKYDFLLPEDDVKKKLEAINMIRVARFASDLNTTLDVGTATGRYPGIFRALGANAFGVDIEPQAIDYASSKFDGVDNKPILSVGDARALEYGDNMFDVVTCMMGTFIHIPITDQLTALREMYRVCRPGGVVAISTWDVECPHLTFLSMYSVREDELIIRNSRTLGDMVEMFREVPFSDIGDVRFGLVPDTISYDLGIEDLDTDGVKRLLEIDLAVRSSAPDKHGQMFICYGMK
ncbi:methyltransferase domain-containing protein [Sphingomonas oligophenolica]|uniref:methyltransferase domain-containing protein n=1 Tax=Sphingomonas oligophenolica TaxID=301154 RepID=UPI0031DBE5A1